VVGEAEECHTADGSLGGLYCSYPCICLVSPSDYQGDPFTASYRVRGAPDTQQRISYRSERDAQLSSTVRGPPVPLEMLQLHFSCPSGRGTRAAVVLRPFQRMLRDLGFLRLR